MVETISQPGQDVLKNATELVIVATNVYVSTEVYKFGDEAFGYHVYSQLEN